jgi:hypothetical protein
MVTELGVDCHGNTVYVKVDPPPTALVAGHPIG